MSEKTNRSPIVIQPVNLYEIPPTYPSSAPERITVSKPTVQQFVSLSMNSHDSVLSSDGKWRIYTSADTTNGGKYHIAIVLVPTDPSSMTDTLYNDVFNLFVDMTNRMYFINGYKVTMDHVASNNLAVHIYIGRPYALSENSVNCNFLAIELPVTTYTGVATRYLSYNINLTGGNVSKAMRSFLKPVQIVPTESEVPPTEVLKYRAIQISTFDQPVLSVVYNERVGGNFVDGPQFLCDAIFFDYTEESGFVYFYPQFCNDAVNFNIADDTTKVTFQPNDSSTYSGFNSFFGKQGDFTTTQVINDGSITVKCKRSNWLGEGASIAPIESTMTDIEVHYDNPKLDESIYATQIAFGNKAETVAWSWITHKEIKVVSKQYLAIGIWSQSSTIDIRKRVISNNYTTAITNIIAPFVTVYINGRYIDRLPMTITDTNAFFQLPNKYYENVNTAYNTFPYTSMK